MPLGLEQEPAAAMAVVVSFSVGLRISMGLSATAATSFAEDAPAAAYEAISNHRLIRVHGGRVLHDNLLLSLVSMMIEPFG